MENTLDTCALSPAPGARSRWVGRVLTAIPVLFLTFDGAIKLTGHPAVAEATIRLGVPTELSRVGATGTEILEFTQPSGRLLGQAQIELPNAGEALNFQRNLIGESVGEYNPFTNSCATHCANVANAGGASVPTTATQML